MPYTVFTKRLLVLAAGFSLLCAPIAPTFADDSITETPVETTAPVTDTSSEQLATTTPDAPVLDAATTTEPTPSEPEATTTPTTLDTVATTTIATTTEPVATTTATTTLDAEFPVVATTTEPVLEDAQTVIVKFKDDAVNLDTSAGKKESQKIAAQEDVSVEDHIESANIAVVASKSGEDAQQTADRLSDNPAIEYAEPNFARGISDIMTDDTYRSELWGLDNIGQILNVPSAASGTPDADIDAPEAWTLSTGTSTVVAVIDSGVLYTHPDLQNQMWDGTNCVSETGTTLNGCVHGYDFHADGTVDNDPIPDDPITTDDLVQSTHGTHVAGIIAAEKNNNEGVVGVAPSAKIMAIKFGFDVASEVKAIDFARENGAKIINASFGGKDYSQTEYDAIKRFQDSGGIFIAAAGNGDGRVGTDNDTTTFYPANYDLSGIVSVAATDQNDSLAPFSNYGSITVDIAAPGVNIMSTAETSTTSPVYLYFSGTSMAAPMVAGAIALADSLYGATSTDTLTSTLVTSGDHLCSLSGKTVASTRLNTFNFLSALGGNPVVPPADITAPVIVLNGDATTTITAGNIYTDAGATATDDIDCTDQVVASSTIDTATPGTYSVTYNATDASGNQAIPVTRTVIVSAPVSSGGGGGGGGGGGSSHTSKKKTPTKTTTTPVTTTVTTGTTTTPVIPAVPQVLGASAYIFTQNLSVGSTGRDVTELQNLLTRLGYFHEGVTGYFGPITATALRAFQAAHGISQTGTVGPLTRAALNQGSPDTATTNAPAGSQAALQALISSLLAQVAALQAQLNAAH